MFNNSILLHDFFVHINDQKNSILLYDFTYFMKHLLFASVYYKHLPYKDDSFCHIYLDIFLSYFV